jgi:hypothetical protein
LSAGIHVHIDVAEFEAAEYAFRVLLADVDGPVTFQRRPPGPLPRDSVLITYGPETAGSPHPRQLAVLADTRLWQNYGRAASLPVAPHARVALDALAAAPSDRLRDPLIVPCVSSSRPPEARIERDGAGRPRRIVSSADIVASAFFWISRYEETLIGERDEFGRIPQRLLLAVREEITDRPLVDEYRALLEGWLEALGSGAPLRRPPFRALITHDVDSGVGVRGVRENLENAARTFYREAIRGGRFGTGLAGFADWTLKAVGVRKEADLFGDITRLDAEFGFPSFFFLMSNGTNPVDATYDVLGDDCRRAIAAIHDAGGKVGYHVGLDAHRRPGQLAAEWERLRQADPSAWPASRSHFLSFFPPKTWRDLVAAGLRVDSTLGYSDHMGFGGGTCRPFRPFDVERREVLPVWEIPMTLMDNNFFRQPAGGDAERLSRARELISRVRAAGGCFVVNWHNVVFFGQYRRIYRDLLAALRDAQPLRLEDLPADGSLVA